MELFRCQSLYRTGTSRILCSQGEADATEAEAALSAAEAARDADLADLSLPAEQLRTRLDAHERNVSAARRRYDAALEAARPEIAWPLADELNAADVSELPALMERMGLGITVSPDRGDVLERVQIVNEERTA